MFNIVCQLLHLDAVLVICSVFASQHYKQELNILPAGFFCRSQVIVLLTQKVSQPPLEANLRPKVSF